MSDPTSFKNERVTATIFAIDIKDAVRLKQGRADPEWLPSFLLLYETVRDIIRGEGGSIVKYQSDGILGVFSEDRTVDAINSAIKVQEALDKARTSNRMSFSCSVGITFGDVQKIEFNDEHLIDYLGRVVDKAVGLAESANANAIFIDEDTAAATQMTRIASTVGQALKRKAVEYKGPPQTNPLIRGIGSIEYHEILWDNKFYGVSSEAVTEWKPQAAGPLSVREPLSRESQSPRPMGGTAPSQAAWLKGRMEWIGARDYGFVKTSNEDFYTNKTYMLGGEPASGATVFFHALDPLPNAKNRRASNVISLNQELHGSVYRLIPEKGFGFAWVQGAGDERMNMFLYLGDSSGSVAVGDDVTFSVSENSKGPIGINPRRKVPAL